MVVKQSCLSMVKQLGTIVVVKQSSLSNYGGKKGLAEPIVMVKQSSLSIVMAKQSSLSIVMAKQSSLPIGMAKQSSLPIGMAKQSSLPNYGGKTS